MLDDKEFLLSTEFIYEKSELLIAFLLLGMFMVVGELGFRLGRKGA